MTSKTRAELAAEVAGLREETGALRALLGAIADAAGSAPQAVYDDREQWHHLIRTRLVQIEWQARAALNGEYPLSTLTRVLAAHAAEPVQYRIYRQEPQVTDSHHPVGV